MSSDAIATSASATSAAIALRQDEPLEAVVDVDEEMLRELIPARVRFDRFAVKGVLGPLAMFQLLLVLDMLGVGDALCAIAALAATLGIGAWVELRRRAPHASAIGRWHLFSMNRAAGALSPWKRKHWDAAGSV